MTPGPTARVPASRRRARTAVVVGTAVGLLWGAASVAGRDRPSATPGQSDWTPLQLATERFEVAAYDLLARASHRAFPPHDDFAYIQINDNDISQLYETRRISWPWSREILGRALTRVREAGASAVVLDLTLPGAACNEDDRAAADALDESRAVVAVDLLTGDRFATAQRALFGRWALGPARHVARDAALRAAAGAYLLPAQPPAVGVQPVLLPAEDAWELWLAGFPTRESALENASVLEDAVPATLQGPPQVVQSGSALGPREIAPAQDRHLVTRADLTRHFYGVRVEGADRLKSVPTYRSVVAPNEALLGRVRRFGVATARLEPDAVFRRAHALAAIDDPDRLAGELPRFLPSLALAAAMEIAGVNAVSYDGTALAVGRYRVPVREDGSFLIEYAPEPRAALPVIEVLRLLDPSLSVPEDERREWRERLAAHVHGRVVFVVNEAKALVDYKLTPLGGAVAGTRIVAAQLGTILRGTPIRRVPGPWDFGAASATALLLALAVAALALRSEPHWYHYVGTFGALAAVAGAHVLVAAMLYRAHLFVAVAAPLFAAATSLAVSLAYAVFSVGAERRHVQELFGRHTSPELAAHLRDHPEDADRPGTLKELTVYFSDIRGFTTLSEQISPQDTVEFLEAYLTALADIVKDHRGIVDKFIGDAIMAFWGALPPVPDHATLGCAAAVAMRDELARLRPAFRERYESRYRATHGDAFRFDIHARAGLSTGPMVVGHIGSTLKRNYTVVGDAVNLGSRLEGANKFYGTQILCSEATFRGGRGAFEFREIGVVRVKGKAKGARIYELLGARGRVDARRLEMAATFAVGLEAFQARRFAEAAHHFEATLLAEPGDGPSTLYLAEGRERIARPPPPDWDGGLDLHEK